MGNAVPSPTMVRITDGPDADAGREGQDLSERVSFKSILERYTTRLLQLRNASLKQQFERKTPATSAVAVQRHDLTVPQVTAPGSTLLLAGKRAALPGTPGLPRRATGRHLVVQALTGESQHG